MTPTEDPEVLWNFEKFLVSARGEVVDRFAPDVTPETSRSPPPSSANFRPGNDFRRAAGRGQPRSRTR